MRRNRTVEQRRFRFTVHLRPRHPGLVVQRERPDVASSNQMQQTLRRRLQAILWHHDPGSPLLRSRHDSEHQFLRASNRRSLPISEEVDAVRNTQGCRQIRGRRRARARHRESTTFD